MEDEKKIEARKEMMHQKDEAKKIGRVIRTIISDMCRSRGVDYNFASDELMTHALAMSKVFYKDQHRWIVEQQGSENIAEFPEVFSKVSQFQFLNAGEKIGDEKNLPSVFDILSGDTLNNINLAKCLFMKKGICIESPSETDFLAGIEGTPYKIQISVYDDAILFFTWLDVFYDNDAGVAMDCARYNSHTLFSKAHVHEEKTQIHFLYAYPHQGTINVEDIARVVLKFMDEYMIQSKKINWGSEEKEKKEEEEETLHS